MSELEQRKPFVLTPGDGESVWSLGGRFTWNDTPPAGLAMPSPDVLGPVAERYGIEVVGPPRRIH